VPQPIADVGVAMAALRVAVAEKYCVVGAILYLFERDRELTL